MLSQDKFRVFVSHKSDDADLATVVSSEIERLAPGQIECWVSGDELRAGVDWDREIKRQLNQSHLLVLLFTTSNHTWDWCLFEVGLFLRFDADEARSVACLHDPDGVPPEPLQQVQCVRASPESVEKQLLRPLCHAPWEVSDTWQRGALALDVADRALTSAAKRISGKFASTLARSAPHDVAADRYHPCHRIVLDLTASVASPQWTAIPRDARVVEGPNGTSSYTLSLFRAHEGSVPRSWGDLVDEVAGDRMAWLRDLDQSFAQSLGHRLWTPSMERMEVWQPGADRRRTYRPIIYEVVQGAGDDQPVGVTIILLPDHDEAV